MEALSQIVVLKPFYKKFCLIRNVRDFYSNKVNCYDVYENNFKIDKLRKNIHLMHKDDETKIKFDYISSLLDNQLEENKLCNENELINNEFSLILLSYATKINSFNDERDFLILFLNESIFVGINSSENLSPCVSKNLLEILIKIISQITEYSEYTLSIKVGLPGGSYYIMKEKHLSIHNNITYQELESVFSMMKHNIINLSSDPNLINQVEDLENDVIYCCFEMKNLKNKSKIKLFNLSYAKIDMVGNLLSKLSEVNISKKRKDKSSKRGKNKNRDVHDILEEMDFNSNFFYVSVLDFEMQDFYKNKYIREILIHL